MIPPKKVVLPISVIIPTYNEEERLPKLLKSIKEQIFAPAEIIVADNSSEDRTREIAEDEGCKVVQGGAVAEGRNRGARASSQNLLLFLDADCVFPHERFIVEMYTEFENENLDILTTLLKPDKSDAKTFQKIASELYFMGSNGLRRLYKYTKKLFAESGGTMLMKRKVFDDVGGFIEQNGVYGEDYDFSLKAIKKGYKYKVFTGKIISSGRRVSSPAKTAKVLAGLALMGVTIAFGLYNRKKLVKVVQKLYGDLGGSTKKE